MQRQLALQVPLAAGYLGPIESTADFHLDALRAESQRLFHRFSHRPAKRNSLLELRSDFLRLQLRVQFRLMNLLNRNQHFAARARRDVALQLIDLGAFATDDDARTRSIDDDLQAIRRPLDVYVRDARAGETLLQFALQFRILDQKMAVLRVA